MENKTNPRMNSLPSGKLEDQFVHQVYDEIAPHFSSTRYKPWPLVDNFLQTLDYATLIADIGCGNGKYLGVNKKCYAVGSDRSANLIDIVNHRKFECLVADGLRIPYQSNRFDVAISIAVIHHFSSPERRLHAIQELFRIVRPGGKVLITVWALEQEKIKSTEQDIFVPWHFKTPKKKKDDPVDEKKEEVVYQRYYHLFKKGELDDLIGQIPNSKILSSQYDHENWYILAEKGS